MLSVLDAQWNTESDVLAVCLHQPVFSAKYPLLRAVCLAQLLAYAHGSRQLVVQLWSMGNYHWYLKHTIPAGEASFGRLRVLNSSWLVLSIA